MFTLITFSKIFLKSYKKYHMLVNLYLHKKITINKNKKKFIYIDIYIYTIYIYDIYDIYMIYMIYI